MENSAGKKVHVDFIYPFLSLSLEYWLYLANGLLNKYMSWCLIKILITKAIVWVHCKANNTKCLLDRELAAWVEFTE